MERRTRYCGVCYCVDRDFDRGWWYCNECPRYIPATPGLIPLNAEEKIRIEAAGKALDQHIELLRHQFRMGAGWLLKG
jgi:hypothetical protein